MIKHCIALGTFIGMIFGLYFWLDSNYASSERVMLVEVRLEQKILSDRAISIQERIWKLEDRFGKQPKDPAILDELRRLYKQLDSTNKSMDQMRGNKK